MDDRYERDEQQPTAGEAPRDPHAENLARYGAPVPPPAFQHQAPSPPTAPAARYPRRRGPRLLAAVTALAAVTVATGAGFALGRIDDHSQPSAGPAAGYPGQEPNGQQFGEGTPFGGTNPFGGTPFSGPGGSGSPFDSSSNGKPASDSQLTGLVRVSATLKYEGGKAAGTGMILTSNGEVVTNHHVVEGATKVRVTVMSTGATYDATVIGTDAVDDVAVLQLQDASGLQTVTPDTDGISVGDAVTAVGDAGGDTSRFTAASGKVTATDQHITTTSEPGHPGEKLRGLIEISSDVISGDSGGATYDTEGEVVGMTTAASSGSRDVVGYAIPIAKVVSIAGDLENGTQSTRYEYGSPAFLGLGLSGNGTRVAQVYPATPAARAGVTAGDTITRIGTTPVRNETQLRDAVRAFSPGDTVRIAWTDASGTSHVASVTLIAGPIA
jgi:S1-C subfamily serine protease